MRALGPKPEPLSELRPVPPGDDPATFRERLAAEIAAEHGRGTGLWTARQVTSRLELIPRADGLTVRLWV